MDHRIHPYIVTSLELHLFFARIMKEHAFFLEAGFTPVNASFAEEAERLKTEFERLLSRAVTLGDGVIRPSVVRSGELITEFTEKAERQTEGFTGITINEGITTREASLTGGMPQRLPQSLVGQVRTLNRTALRLLAELISLKERILRGVLSCRMFTLNYPLLIEHILREARLYQGFLLELEGGVPVTETHMGKTEQFWNRIMMEHAQFIRGLLDPTEEALIASADGFAKDYARLLEQAKAGTQRTMCDQPNSSLEETLAFRDFKAAGTKGVSCCEIRSIILPLLADHVLREANHYIRLLKKK